MMLLAELRTFETLEKDADVANNIIHEETRIRAKRSVDDIRGQILDALSTLRFQSIDDDPEKETWLLHLQGDRAHARSVQQVLRDPKILETAVDPKTTSGRICRASKNATQLRTDEKKKAFRSS